MLSTITNFHHSKIPKIGEIGKLVEKHDRFGFPVYFENGARVIVSHYPLCDNVLPWSKGIHTAFFRNLKNGKIVRYSGFYFEN